MRTYRTEGPFPEAVYYEPHEIDEICAAALRKAGLLPSSPEPIRIDRFVEKYFKITPQYEELPDGVLGCTLFGPTGVVGMKICRSLDDEHERSVGRRLRSTFAHEAGHGLLHAHLFAIDSMDRGRRSSSSGERQRVMCRDEEVGSRPPATAGRPRNPRWWEVQANMAIGALLLPAHLVRQVVETHSPPVPGTPTSPTARADLIKAVSEVFDVNPQVADIRLGAFGVRAASRG